jgi:hypothetical protein
MGGEERGGFHTRSVPSEESVKIPDSHINHGLLLTEKHEHDLSIFIDYTLSKLYRQRLRAQA